VLFMLCGTAYLIESAPGLANSQPPWVVPLRLMSIISPAIFQLYASAAFDDSFRPVWLAWLPTAAMAGLGGWAMVAHQALPWHFVQAAALMLVAVGVWQVLGGREGDLVEGRRRFRLVLAIGAGLAIAGITALGFVSKPEVRGYGSLISVTIVLALALTSAMARLGLRLQAELVAELPVGPAVPLNPMASAAVAIDPEERALLDRLQHQMEIERIYREEGLGIAALADRLGLPQYRLRRLINQRLGHRNFTSFINGYRLAEAIAALSDASQAQVPILTIALDAGFQSIGPFNRAFKAQTGVTPSDFRREQLERIATRAAE
jgi:AraC-like DNA-binding protein